MNTAKILHNTAMEFYDLAKIAKAKGKVLAHDDYLQKAYTLDKEAALKMQSGVDDDFWKYVYVRSAGWLAYQCGQFEEAKSLAIIGLSGKPPAIEKAQLQELLSLTGKQLNIKKKASFTSNKNELEISGILASADLDEGKIKIRENGKRKYRVVHVAKDLIQNIVRLYMGEIVRIEASLNEKNLVVLKTIRLAA